MQSKLQSYTQMAREVAAGLTKSYQKWAAFLTTASRLYKYPFPDQMMIFAQRPDATACAEYDLWNNTMNRYVRRGSKGIALLDDSGYQLRLRYVFDVSDTGARENARQLNLWQYRPEHEAAVSDALEAAYGIPLGDGLPDQLAKIAARLASEYWQEHGSDILDIVDGSLLEEYDDLNIQVVFRNAATASITYALIARCGLGPENYFEHEDFLSIFDFNTAAVVNALGTAVSQSSQEVLRQIGITIRHYENERRSEHERTDLHPEGRLPVSEPDADGTGAREVSGQVREDAEIVPEGASPGGLQQFSAVRQPDDAPSGDRRDGPGPDGGSVEEAGGTGRRDGEPESRRPDEMGRTDEQLQGPGRGNDSVGTYIQLTLPLFPTEEEQIQHIHTAESVKASSAFTFSQDDIDDAIRGEPERHGILNGRSVTRQGDTITIGDGLANHEIDITVSDEQWEQIKETVPEMAAERAPEPVGNFRIIDDTLGKGGPKEKFWRNIKAIAVLKQIEGEGRSATLEEQHILSQYVGWGGLADAFDGNKPAWASEYKELKELLTPEEYDSARASTLNAHYTSPTVIKAIYEAIGNLGFKAGNILEPSCGVGNFFGLLPESMTASHLYGVELDPISGNIAKKLYPEADITVAGFETTDRRDFYDLAVGNVPFGQYQVNDPAYNKLGFTIHNYFFAKALDQVRPGGVVAFVTSRYTMDAKSPEVRKYLAQRAELLGAIRLPNNAFKANAGTEVVSDIIFLQKRDRPVAAEPDWVHLGEHEDGFAINSYFADHPEMILGRLSQENTQYSRQDITVEPIEGMEFADQLQDAVRYIRGTYQEAEMPDLGDGEAIDQSIPADPNVKNYSYTVVGEEVYFRENSCMVRPGLSAVTAARMKGMVALRDCVHQLIDLQMDEYISDSVIQGKQTELNRMYDSFTAKYGLINDRGNRLAFSDDSSYYLLCALEVLDEDGKLERKADMFTKRTIKPHRAVSSVDTASEALAVSIAEKARVDMEYMAQLAGKTTDQIAAELTGVIFKDPACGDDALSGWQTADEYLSGNVRRKLRQAQRAAERDPAFSANVEALKAAQPKDLDASEIEVRLGATWVSPDYIRQFMYETFDTPRSLQGFIDVKYAAYTAEWRITAKNAVSYTNVAAYTTYGTGRANAYHILEDSLNLRDVRVYDTVEDADGKERRVLNAKETTLAAQKQQAIREAFKDWIWKDPQRRQELVCQYNEEMNSTRPREYDGSHIVFSGMNPEITLHEHQKNAVAHVMYGGNTLLAHEVGAGKTFEMVAAAMESKRLGLCQKSIFVVPNHLTEQWASEFLRLYPSANILVTTKKDFETRNRKKFCARIATGDYDAVIIGHSQFERIPISRERQERLLREQISEITDGIAEVKGSGGEQFTIKQLERTRKGLETRLEKLQADGKKDDVVTFEQLGVDRMFVDEAHNYKNMFLYTKMRNVAGLSTTDAQKSSDMFAKCRYLDEITGSRGVVFATGTPVSNSMTELYTMQRYLQYERLKEMDMTHFDCWASRFGETATALELAPEGTGYRARTRFSKFFNLPELMNLFKEIADIKTADQLHLPVPEVEYHNVVAKPTEPQKAMVQVLSERAAKVHAGSVDPSVDNMLKITSDGRKLGLDQRIINPMLPDEEGTKVNQCVGNILQIWRDGEAEKLTQLVFCDISTPKAQASRKAAKAVTGNLDNPELHALETAVDLPEEEPEFTVYEDIRQKLVSQGVPAEQIAFIHEANTEFRKKELFAKVRTGQIRVLLGSTFKMGAGTNVQDRLVAIHDLDCPWRPGDLEQRKGRIVRQGNGNETVHVYRYVTEGTFDGYLWVRHEVA